ncbi:hypothetical protein EST38_g9376 [Candolleomyces aberdarensis]|uniref:Uncharacterized protein n=1 Tax=Candolleomyces aberdarensis TaxID=2316362 RepID=A0A4Q2DDB9_9AGAR|nr:hypothetical protein EST38_g9376 [Candolleomyces aberdarensis]
MEVHVEWDNWLVGLQMKSHYWYHNELFPHLYELADDDIDEIDDIVGYAMGDIFTSSCSAVHWDPEKLGYLQTMVHRYGKKGPKGRRRSVGERRTICRMLSSFYEERFLNLFGDKVARLSSTQSVHYSEHRRRRIRDTASVVAHGTTQGPWYRRIAKAVLPWMWRRGSADEGNKNVNYEDASPPVDAEAKGMLQNSLVLNIFSLIMFGGPGIHMQQIRELALDRLVRQRGYKNYVEKMLPEWRDITLYATVILAANMSFLTIGSVDEVGSAGPNRTNSQRASYLSILASMGTIMFSLLLARLFDPDFVVNRSVSRWGLESLAILYGMPFALLLWSMVSFFLSFAILWYQGEDNVVIAMVSISCFIFAVIMAWGVKAAHEKEYESYLEKVVEKVAEKVGKVRKKVGKTGRKIERKVRTENHYT